MRSPVLTIRTLLSISLIGLSSLSLELVLTKIFSVSMYHHFAFLAISVALFGLGASGMFLYIFPRWFPADKILTQLGWISLFFGLSVTFSFLMHLHIPFTPGLNPKAFALLGLKYSLMVIPFFFSGLCLALALKHFPAYAGKIYFADLIGAGSGCLVTVPLLSILGGASSVIFVSIICCISSVLFFTHGNAKTRTLCIPFVTLFFFISFLLINIKYHPVHVKSASNIDKSKIVYEDWNSFSRVAVYNLKGRGLLSTTSKRFTGNLPNWKFIEIDSTAGSHLLDFSKGKLEDLEYLKHDISFIAYHLGSDQGKVLIIGPGGGRDVLGARIFGHNEIYGVEVNPIMIEIVEDVFGEFSGNLYSRPGVHIIVDEARSYLSRCNQRFDFIQATLACTWASSAAGSFVLSENSLYTKEAFLSYLNHLKKDGILAVTMWFRGLPAEMLRLVSLGLSSLNEIEVRDPRKHIIVMLNKKRARDNRHPTDGYGTFLLKKLPFTPYETEKLREVCHKLDFDIYYSPDYSGNVTFNRLVNSPESFIRSFPLDISPPVDDRPFFFYLLKFRDFWKAFRGEELLTNALEGNEFLFHIVFILIGLLLITITLSLLFIIAPLFIFRKHTIKNKIENMPYLLFFACIGLGYILIEISLLQRFSLFLGKPIYSLSVILFSLLVFSGIGSYLTNNIHLTQCRKKLTQRTFLLVVLLIFYVCYLPELFHHLIELSSVGRIIVSVFLLSPLGLVMGMPFPIGIRLANMINNEMIPWAWAINGTTSVLASVISIIIAISFGFTVTLVIGQFFYLCALLLTIYFKGISSTS